MTVGVYVGQCLSEFTTKGLLLGNEKQMLSPARRVAHRKGCFFDDSQLILWRFFFPLHTIAVFSNIKIKALPCLHPESLRVKSYPRKTD